MEIARSVYRPMPRQLPIASEGLPFVFIAASAAALLWLTGLAIGALLMSAVAIFVVFFFRNPERTVPAGEGILVAPADGRVIAVGRGVRSPHTGAACTRVSIFMSVFNVHINRFPLAARVVRSIYRPGKFFVASLDKASEQNEQNALVLEDARGRHVVLVQIAGLVARRIVCYMKEGMSAGIGERYGLIRFGSRLDIYLPPEAKVEVAAGARTRAGETVIGRLP